MSRRYNTKHNRGSSNYKLRLQDRGLSRTPVMRDYVGVKSQSQETDKYGKKPKRSLIYPPPMALATSPGHELHGPKRISRVRRAEGLEGTTSRAVHLERLSQ